jgi:molybdopterin converting factor small subunit
MRVLLPSPLFSYSGGQREVEAHGACVADVLHALDARYPGLRHRIVDEQDRIRPHIRFFVNGEAVTTLGRALAERDELVIVAALSGG